MRRHIAGIGGKTIDTFFDNRCCYHEQPLGVSDASIDINFEGVTCARANSSNFVVYNQSTRSTSLLGRHKHSVCIRVEFRIVFERINTQFVFDIRRCNMSVSDSSQIVFRNFYSIVVEFCVICVMCESRRVLCNEISIKRVSNLIVFSCDATYHLTVVYLFLFPVSKVC